MWAAAAAQGREKNEIDSWHFFFRKLRFFLHSVTQVKVIKQSQRLASDRRFSRNSYRSQREWKKSIAYLYLERRHLYKAAAAGMYLNWKEILPLIMVCVATCATSTRCAMYGWLFLHPVARGGIWRDDRVYTPHSRVHYYTPDSRAHDRLRNRVKITKCIRCYNNNNTSSENDDYDGTFCNAGKTKTTAAACVAKTVRMRGSSGECTRGGSVSRTRTLRVNWFIIILFALLLLLLACVGGSRIVIRGRRALVQV